MGSAAAAGPWRHGHRSPSPPPLRSPQAATTRATALRHLGPNWYASVMGTAIVATAGAGLPVTVPGPAHRLRRRLGAVAGHARRPARRPGPALDAPPRPGPRPPPRPGDGPLLRLPRPWPCWPWAAAPWSSAGTGSARQPAVALDAVLFTAGTVDRPRRGRGRPVPDGRPPPRRARARPPPCGCSPSSPRWSPRPSAPCSSPISRPARPSETLLLACFAMFGLSLLATLADAAADLRPADHRRPAAARPHPDPVPGARPARPVHDRRRQVRGLRARRGARPVRPGFRRSSPSSTASP